LLRIMTSYPWTIKIPISYNEELHRLECKISDYCVPIYLDVTFDGDMLLPLFEVAFERYDRNIFPVYRFKGPVHSLEPLLRECVHAAEEYVLKKESVKEWKRRKRMKRGNRKARS